MWFRPQKKPKYPPKILVTGTTKGMEYAINKMLYVHTPVHHQSVVLHILDGEGIERCFFIPDRYADTFRRNFNDENDFNCHEAFLRFEGFENEELKVNPTFKVVYKGQAQHQN